MLIPITIIDEFEEKNPCYAQAKMNMLTGQITQVEYEDPQSDFPALDKEYEFTCGTLRNGEKEVEFCIQVDKKTKRYWVQEEELEELKVTAAALFSAMPVNKKALEAKVKDGAAIVVPKKGKNK